MFPASLYEAEEVVIGGAAAPLFEETIPTFRKIGDGSLKGPEAWCWSCTFCSNSGAPHVDATSALICAKNSALDSPNTRAESA